MPEVGPAKSQGSHVLVSSVLNVLNTADPKEQSTLLPAICDMAAIFIYMFICCRFYSILVTNYLDNMLSKL
jgi:hypothetical protein